MSPPATSNQAGMLSDWYKSYLNKPPEAATYTAANAGASTWAPDANSTVQGQLTKVLDAGGPLMQRVETKAKQGMLPRGLGNSSIAIGAGQSALYDAAMPIASQDAGTFADAGKTNAQLGTQVSIANAGFGNDAGRFNAGSKNDMAGMIFRSAADFGLEDKRQTFQAGESATDRTWRTGERLGSEGFQAGENAADRTFRTGERVAGQDFTAGQAGIDRKFRTGERTGAEIFEAGQNALQRSFQSGERVSQNDFSAAQSVLDRDQQLRVQQLQESGMDARQANQVAAQERAQKADQTFTTEQKARDQQFSSAERVEIQKFETERLQVQNTFSARMQELQETGMDVRQAKQQATQEALTARELLSKLKEEFDIVMHPNTLSVILKQMKFVWKRTRHNLKKSEMS